MIYLLIVSLFSLTYFTGGLIWLQREKQLRVERYQNPWKEAIERRDWDACHYWDAISRNYPLLEPRVVINPFSWIRYWNWTPPNPQVDKFSIEVAE